jgi:Ca2+-binding EF-hand superfamily protein
VVYRQYCSKSRIRKFLCRSFFLVLTEHETSDVFPLHEHYDRSTVVCATEACSLHELRGSDFLDVISSSPELAESLRDMSRKRMFKKAIKKLSMDNKRGFASNDLEAAFDQADKDRSGTLNLEELTLLFKGMDPDFPETDVIAFLKYIDLDEDGRMSLAEFKLLFRSCAAD